MAEANEMGSVEGQLVGLPLAGPESFSIQQLAYLKRALGLDETVLYDSNSDDPSQILANTTFNLTESYLNFEKVRIYLKCSAGDTSNVSYMVEGLVRSSVATELSTIPITTSAATLQYDCCTFAFALATPTVCTARPYGSRIAVTNSGAFSKVASRGPSIFKIVGIHRIAGGN